MNFLHIPTSLRFFALGMLLGGSMLFLAIHRYNSKKKQDHRDLIQTALDKAQDILEKAEEKAEKMLHRTQEEISTQRNTLERREKHLEKKELKLDRKEQTVDAKQLTLTKQETYLQTLLRDQEKKLEEISAMTYQEAHDTIMQSIQKTYDKEFATYLDKMKRTTHQNAKKEAMNIISSVMPKVAYTYIDDFTSVLVALPNEDAKGRIIGRDGRNIMFFEKYCGVNLIVDDTPMVVKISSHDHQKRYVAQLVLEKLLKDGRINPSYIESTYHDVLHMFDDMIREKGQQTCNDLMIGMMHDHLIELIGKSYFRYSYGQNLLHHSIEVATIAGLLAEEMGFDSVLAKKAGLLHDIGKVVAQTGESHTIIGGQILKQYGASPIAINAAESHHYDVPMTHPISWIVATADTLSAARPGARFDTKNLFLERMKDLEQLIISYPGVEKTHIMQAGREIMVFVNPDDISDTQLHHLLQELGQTIEQQIEYPGIIRLVAIRERTMTTYIR